MVRQLGRSLVGSVGLMKERTWAPVSTRGRLATPACCLRKLQLPAALGERGSSEATGEAQRPLGLVVSTGAPPWEA